jgi:gliding motility-associated lipoprotein GldH
MKQQFFRTNFILIVLAGCFVLSCRQIDVYEKNTPIPNYEWQNSFAATGTFTIEDTAAFYNVSIVLRHTDAYAYNNVWLNVGLQSPGDSMYFQKVDLQLGTDATGWEGSGMNDIWEIRKLLNGQAQRFRKGGTYQYQIFQLMRDQPLKHILSAGLRVEKMP